MIIIFHHFFATHNSLTHFRFSVVFSGFLKGFLGLVFRVSIKTQLKQKVKDSFEQSRTLIGTITGTATFECIANLPTCSFLFRTINRERTQDLVNPQTLGEKSVSLELQKTLRGENFLAYDSGSDDAERFSERFWTFTPMEPPKAQPNTYIENIVAILSQVLYLSPVLKLKKYEKSWKTVAFLSPCQQIQSV